MIKYIKGIKNAKANALSRKLGYKRDKTYKEVVLLYTLENRDLVLNIQEVAVTNVFNKK